MYKFYLHILGVFTKIGKIWGGSQKQEQGWVLACVRKIKVRTLSVESVIPLVVHV